ncbi:MAG TPA: ABC transporter substrate-binding protein [Candidatus Magasanikbacteria bacterium]|nr:ABC transporter substrate-binding protein [Candidatus Magasanikbacteria bacterium]
MITKKRLLVLPVSVLLVATLVGCSRIQNKDVATIDNSPIKIGVIGPMTGELASYGEQAKLAIDIATDEINNTGGINGRKLETIFEDGQCDTKPALNAANKLIFTDKVPTILTLCSSETLAVSTIAEQNKTIILSFSSTNPKITEAGDYIFRLAPSDIFQGKFAADYTYTKLNKKRVAIIYNSDTEWSTGVKEQFKQNFIKLGGQIVAEEGVLSDARDYRSSLLKIKESNPDLIYFPSLVNSTIIGLKQIKEAGIQSTILGGDVWDDTKIPETLGSSVDGMRFTIMANKTLPSDFVNNMEKDPHGKNINAYSPRAYDAVQVLAKIMREVGTNTDAIKAKLYALNDYPGIAENYTMDENGDLSNTQYTIKEFRGGKIVEVK